MPDLENVDRRIAAEEADLAERVEETAAEEHAPLVSEQVASEKVDPFETVEAPEPAPLSTLMTSNGGVSVTGTITGSTATFPAPFSPLSPAVREIDPEDVEEALQILSWVLGFPAGELKTRLTTLESRVAALEEKLRHHGICGPQS